MHKNFEMIRVSFAIFATLMLLGVDAGAQQSKLPLLPQDLGEWTRVSYSTAGLPGPTARVLAEYGSLGAATAMYVSGGKRQSVTVHRMRDAVGAYGAETFFRGRTGREGQRALRLGDFLVFRATEDLEAALRTYLEPLQGRQMQPPALPEYLPSEGLIGGSQRFLMGPEALATFMPLSIGDWAGFAYGAEAEYAEYRLGSGRTQFVILNYPTPQIALARLEEMSSVLNLNGQGLTGRPLVHVLREGTLLFLATGSRLSADAANELLASHRYARELAITEAEPEMTQEEWLGTIGSVFINTGVLTMLVVVLAVLLGGARLAVSSLWPGRVFDRPDATEIIQLEIPSRDRSEDNP